MDAIAYAVPTNLSSPGIMYATVTTLAPILQTAAAAANSNATSISGIMKFQAAYRPIHGVLAPIICVLGIIANCLNIMVLTRKNMVSPTNVLLTWLAISDGLTMMAYLPFSILNYHIYKTTPSPLANAKYVMFFAIFSVVVHSISIWLTVSLAVFRYVFIRYPRRGAKLCSIYRAKLTVFIVCVVVTLVCIPNSVSYKFGSEPRENNQTSWHIMVRTDSPGYQFLKNFNLWIQALLVKLIPCLLLTVLSMLLIKQMNDAEKRRKKLFNKSNGKAEDDSCRHRKTNRTTRMLVVVVVLFVVTETPQGIMHMVGGIIDEFFTNVYSPLGDLLDTLTLFNNGINFVLYCTMSKQFRDTFIKTFLSEMVKPNHNNGRSAAETKMITVTVPTQRVSEV